MAKQEARPTPESEEFDRLVSILRARGETKTLIAQELKIIDGSSIGDVNALNKICKGVIGSTHGKRTSELLNELKNIPKYKSIIDDILIDVNNYQHMFIVYYWSDRNEVELVVLAISKETGNSGESIYLTKMPTGEYIPLQRKILSNYTYLPYKAIEFEVQKKIGGRKTMLLANISGKELDEVKFVYCSYCGSMSKNNSAYAGIGILEYVEPGKFNER